MLNESVLARNRAYYGTDQEPRGYFSPRFFYLNTYGMETDDEFCEEYDLEVERAISVFYGKHENTEGDFMDSCQLLVDSGVWLMDAVIGETCLFLLENGTLFLPETDQFSPDGEFMIIGTPRKNVVN